MGPSQHNVGSLVEYRINKLKCYYYTAQYIAHMTGGAHTAVYALKSSHVLDTFTSQLCRVSMCVEANFKHCENFQYIRMLAGI